MPGKAKPVRKLTSAQGVLGEDAGAKAGRAIPAVTLPVWCANPHTCIVYGPPGSGKTTLHQRIIDSHPSVGVYDTDLGLALGSEPKKEGGFANIPLGPDVTEGKISWIHENLSLFLSGLALGLAGHTKPMCILTNVAGMLYRAPDTAPVFPNIVALLPSNTENSKKGWLEALIERSPSLEGVASVEWVENAWKVFSEYADWSITDSSPPGPGESVAYSSSAHGCVLTVISINREAGSSSLGLAAFESAYAHVKAAFSKAGLLKGKI